MSNIEFYRRKVTREQTSETLYKTAMVVLEVSAITAIIGRGLKYVAREMGYNEPRRIRFPMD